MGSWFAPVWNSLTAGYAVAPSLAEGCIRQVEQAYAGRKRFYHNADHILALLKLSAAYRQLLKAPNSSKNPMRQPEAICKKNFSIFAANNTFRISMKFQVGDKVVVLHSNEEGEVVDIINPKMVMVDVRGVKFPAYTDQLDFPYFKQFSQKKLFPEKQKTYIDNIAHEKKKVLTRVADGVWLTFIPVMHADEFGDDVVDDLKIHLINRTHTELKFTYKLSYSGDTDFELVNQVRSFEDFYLHDIPFENLNDSPTFSFEFSLLVPDKNKADYFESSLKLKAKQVFTRIEQLKEKGEATFSYKLFEAYPHKEYNSLDVSPLLKKGYKVYDAGSAREHLEPAKHEIDLHIEELTPDPDKLDNFEKLTLQLQTFEKYMDLSIAHRRPSLIVIHGVGTGKLRDEIHDALRVKKEVSSFINRYHPAYGYGATEVYFKY